MGDLIPESINALKPKGTLIKFINKGYYVYTNSKHKDEATGKWKTDPGKLVGKIVPGLGYIPKGTKVSNSGITCYDYGSYLLAMTVGKEEFELLKKCFNAEESLQLFSLACIFAIEGFVGIKPAESYYERSLMRYHYPNVKFSYHTISKLLSYVGRTDNAYTFQKLCLESANTLAVDGHVLPSDSNNSDLSFNGYKAKECKGQQMNLLVALDIDSHLPVATKVFPGYMVDKSDFSEFIEPLGNMENKLFIMDNGFYSEDNVNFIKSKKADYIMPLAKSTESYKEAIKPSRGRKPQFLYHSDKQTDIIEYSEIQSVTKGKRVIFFKNQSENDMMVKQYMQKIEEGSKSHTEEKLEKYKKSFGVIVLETSLSCSAKEVYNFYKSRWAIETYYDRIKNTLDFSELNQSDYGEIQGLAFVMLIGGRLNQKILKAAKLINKGGKELLRIMSALKLYKSGKRASVCNTKKEHIEIAKKLNLSFDPSIKILS